MHLVSLINFNFTVKSKIVINYFVFALRTSPSLVLRLQCNLLSDNLIHKSCCAAPAGGTYILLFNCFSLV